MPPKKAPLPPQPTLSGSRPGAAWAWNWMKGRWQRGARVECVNTGWYMRRAHALEAGLVKIKQQLQQSISAYAQGRSSHHLLSFSIS
jgi:hypothetical protein